MIIKLFLSRSEIRLENITHDDTVVIIDVLRASTTIVAALNNGCHSITPVPEVDEAKAQANLYSREDIVLGGERGGKLIPGFDLSNSPMEYTADKVSDKHVIFTTTNGAQLFKFAGAAQQTVVCSFVNLKSISEFIKKFATDVVILCAGNYEQFGLEDAVCGGMLVSELLKDNKIIELNDGAKAGHILYQNYADNILNMLKQSDHGKRMIDISQKKDLEFCSKINSIPLVPIFNGDLIVRL